MAWNDPGGKDRDPWGNRGGDQGPPDLDEAFRKLQAQLANIFGSRRGGGGGGGGGSGGLSPGVIGAGVGLALIVYGFLGAYQIDAQERGVVFRFGAMLPDIVMPGLHWNPPIMDRVEKVNVTGVNFHHHQALMLTKDENIVDVSITVQYVIDDPKTWLIGVRQPDVSLDHATESALRHVVGSSLMDSVITEGRASIGAEVQERLQSYLNRYGTGILVSKVNIDASGPPKQVQDAFIDVQKAKEDEQRVINEATAYAEGIIPEARGDARRQIEQANAYRDRVIARAEGEAARFKKLLAEYERSKKVTRDRLYIDSLEQVLGRSSKVLVDVQGGNNVMYLPLDRMTRPSSIPEPSSSDSDAARQAAIDAITREVPDRNAPRSSR
jgi:membrane protease subunit HflK